MGRSCAGNYVALRLLVPAVCSMLSGDRCSFFMIGVFLILCFIQKWSPVGSCGAQFVVDKVCEISELF
jgi:hypothetical protein